MPLTRDQKEKSR